MKNFGDEKDKLLEIIEYMAKKASVAIDWQGYVCFNEEASKNIEAGSYVVVRSSLNRSSLNSIFFDFIEINPLTCGMPCNGTYLLKLKKVAGEAIARLNNPEVSLPFLGITLPIRASVIYTLSDCGAISRSTLVATSNQGIIIPLPLLFKG